MTQILSVCKPPFIGTIVAIHLPEKMTARLNSLGFDIGHPICLCNIAPMGDPYLVEVLGIKYAIRSAVANGIIVQ